LACGVDPEKCSLFVQSAVHEHTELTWILTTVTPYGDLTRMTQFKDKSEQNSDNINAGLFTYPILMAADILIYKADIIPVGEDQLQHLELTREVARRFNSTFSPVFSEPKGMLTETPRILGLDGKYKMSKSLNNYISLGETEQTLWEKLRGAKTDEARIKRTDPGNPDVCNVFTLHKNFSGEEEVQEINTECRKAGIGCVDCKKKLMKNILTLTSPIREKIEFFRSKPENVYEILEQGAQNCKKIASQTMKEVKSVIGLKRF